jgi:hypothetical protein
MIEKDMLQILQNAGFSTGMLYYSHMPPEPKTMVCVKTTPGLGPDEVHSGDPIRRPSMTVISRSTSYDIADTNAHLAWTALRKYNVEVNGTVYLGIQPNDEPAEAGKDADENRIILFTVEIHK